MSKHINVNPGQYKVAGREHPGDSPAAKAPKQPAATNKNNAPAIKRRRGKSR